MKEILNGFLLQLLWGAFILYKGIVGYLRCVCAFYLFFEGLLVSIQGQFLLEECTWIPLKNVFLILAFCGGEAKKKC